MGNQSSTNNKLFAQKTSINITKNMIMEQLHHDSNENIVVEQHEFIKRFTDNTKLADGQQLLEGFDWNNVILGGGFILANLDKEIFNEQYEDSDLDFFVYGQNKKILLQRMREIFMFFVNKLSDVTYNIFQNTYIINIESSNFNRHIQLIGVFHNDPLSVLSVFDLTHCQVGYNGVDILYTPEFENAMITRVSRSTTQIINTHRIVKTLKRGFMFERHSDNDFMCATCKSPNTINSTYNAINKINSTYNAINKINNTCTTTNFPNHIYIKISISDIQFEQLFSCLVMKRFNTECKQYIKFFKSYDDMFEEFENVSSDFANIKL